MPQFTKYIFVAMAFAGLMCTAYATVLAADEPPNRANQPITCRAGNICTYPDGTVLPSKTTRSPSPSVSRSARKAFAEPPSYILDGQTYTRAGLISDFIRMAFPSRLWFDADVEARNDFKSPAITSGLGVSVPSWAREYVNRTDGVPRFDGLNRWKGDTITVGFDWPKGVWKAGNSEHYKPLAEQVTALAPQIQAATGLQVRLLSRSEESRSHFARIRIITTASFGATNRFKAPLKRSGGAVGSAMVLPIGLHPPFEDLLFGSIPFTPFLSAQVDGYLLTDKDNNIDLVVCKIAPEHQSHLQQALVTECLARAFGLPESSLTNEDAFLGRWNKAHEPHSFLSFQAAEAATRSEELKTFPHGLTDVNKTQRRLTDYDLAMLSLLYCPSLKSGMGRYDVLTALYHADECFQSLQQAK